MVSSYIARIVELVGREGIVEARVAMLCNDLGLSD